MRVKSFSVPASLQLPSAQNNPYAQEAFSGGGIFCLETSIWKCV